MVCYRDSFTFFFSYGATAPTGALAYLHETLRFHFGLLDLRHSVGLLGRVIGSSQGLSFYYMYKSWMFLLFNAL
jgi:hypothetical protein